MHALVPRRAVSVPELGGHCGVAAVLHRCRRVQHTGWFVVSFLTHVRSLLIYPDADIHRCDNQQPRAQLSALSRKLLCSHSQQPHRQRSCSYGPVARAPVLLCGDDWTGLFLSLCCFDWLAYLLTCILHRQALPTFFAAIVLFYLALALLRVPFVVFASGAQLLAQMVSYTHAQT